MNDPAIRVRDEFVVADEPTTWLHPLKHPPPLGKKLQLLTYTGIATYGTWRWDGGCIAWAPCLKIPNEFKRMIGKLPDWDEIRHTMNQP